MRPLLRVFPWLLAILSLSCRQVERREQFSVACTLHGAVSCDSAVLCVLDDDYGRMRTLGVSRPEDSVFAFSGHIDRAAIAVVSFFADSVVFPFQFILEPADIGIDIAPGRWLIGGGAQNRSYQRFLNRHDRLQAERDSLWRRYVRLGRQDSTLTWKSERELARADSILQDSMQLITVERINRGDPAGRLIRQRLQHRLTRASLDRLR